MVLDTRNLFELWAILIMIIQIHGHLHFLQILFELTRKPIIIGSYWLSYSAHGFDIHYQACLLKIDEIFNKPKWSFHVLQGIVFMDRDVLGWRPIAKSWLEDRTHQEVHVSARI